jgi:hypothetical protein
MIGFFIYRKYMFKEEIFMRGMTLIFIAILLIFSVNIFAQGESAVPFLLIAPGARAGGMGEAGVAYANDATAIYWNPAGLAFQYEDPEVDARREISLMHSKWLPQFNFSDLWYDYMAGRFYMDDLGMFGASITYMNLGENVQTDDQGNTLGTFDSFEYAITGSYATKLKQNLSIGVNLKFIQSNLTPSDLQVGAETTDGTGTSFAIDLGVLWIPAYDFLHNRLSFGANLANVGPKVTYNDKAQADPLPTNLRVGLAYKILDSEFNRLTAVYDMNRMLVYREGESSDNVFKAAFYSAWFKGSLSERIRRFTHALGLEYWYGNLIALRAGYFYEDEDYGARKFATFGGGIAYSIFAVDFSYIWAKNDHPLGDTMRFSIAVKF